MAGWSWLPVSKLFLSMREWDNWWWIVNLLATELDMVLVTFWMYMKVHMVSACVLVSWYNSNWYIWTGKSNNPSLQLITPFLLKPEWLYRTNRVITRMVNMAFGLRTSSSSRTLNLRITSQIKGFSDLKVLPCTPFHPVIPLWDEPEHFRFKVSHAQEIDGYGIIECQWEEMGWRLSCSSLGKGFATVETW